MRCKIIKIGAEFSSMAKFTLGIFVATFFFLSFAKFV